MVNILIESAEKYSARPKEKCMDIKKLIGETTEYDKKQAVEKKKIKSWCKSVSAFANTFGGSLVFGISNDDEIVGIIDAKEDSEFISQKIKERISPIPAFNLRFEVVNGKKLIIVDVLAGKDTPFYYVGDGTTEAYIRVGNESVVANAMELKRLVLRGANETFDLQSSGYKLTDYAFTKLRERYKKVTGKSFENKDFESFELVDADGILTNAGALLADECPIRHSRVFCVRWNGINKSNGKGEAYDSEEYSGSLITLLNESTAFIRRNMRKAWRKLPDSRENMPDYMERGYFEALVNGLIHREYLELGSEVHVDMFDDRMEIYSPGGMVDGTFIQNMNLETVPSKRRNPVLADVFARLDYMERNGSGIGKIIDACEFAVNYTDEKAPIFYSDRSQFRVTLPNLNYDQGGTESSDDFQSLNSKAPKLEKKALEKALEKQIIELMRQEPSITQVEIAKQVELSRSKVQSMVKELLESGRIERTGGKRYGKWVVKA